MSRQQALVYPWIGSYLIERVRFARGNNGLERLPLASLDDISNTFLSQSSASPATNSAVTTNENAQNGDIGNEEIEIVPHSHPTESSDPFANLTAMTVGSTVLYPTPYPGGNGAAWLAVGQNLSIDESPDTGNMADEPPSHPGASMLDEPWKSLFSGCA